MKFRLPSTLSVLYVLAGTAIAWEIKTIVDRTAGNTFSATTRELGEEQTAIPMGIGLVAGHLSNGASLKFQLCMLGGYIMGRLGWPLLDKSQVQAMQGQTTNTEGA